MTSERLDRLTELLNLRGEDPFLRYAQLLEFIRLERPEDALSALEWMIHHHPDYLATYYTGAHFLELQGQSEAAAALYRQGLTLARKLGEQKTAAELQAALDLLEG